MSFIALLFPGNLQNARCIDAYGYEPDYAYGTAPGYTYSPGYAYGQGYGTGGRDDAYCAQRYRSYDPASGTYLGYDGVRHSCP